MEHIKIELHIKLFNVLHASFVFEKHKSIKT